MKKLIGFFTLLILTLALAGCQTILLEKASYKGPYTPSIDNFDASSYLYGLIEGGPTEAYKVCPKSDIARIKFEYSSDNLIMGMVPIYNIIVQFRSNYVHCIMTPEDAAK